MEQEGYGNIFQSWEPTLEMYYEDISFHCNRLYCPKVYVTFFMTHFNLLYCTRTHLKCKYCTSKLSTILSHATLVARTTCFSLTVGCLELICNVSESDEPQNTNSYATRLRKLLLGCKLSSGSLTKIPINMMAWTLVTVSFSFSPDVACCHATMPTYIVAKN